MEKYKDYLVLVGIFISAVAVMLSRRSVGYARINLFNTIQNMMLQKAKDCNQIYLAAYTEWRSDYKGMGYDPPGVGYGSTIIEVYISVKLLENTLNEFRISHKFDFFMIQFWLQLDGAVRKYIRTYDPQIAESEESKNQLYLFEKFGPLFSIY